MPKWKIFVNQNNLVLICHLCEKKLCNLSFWRQCLKFRLPLISLKVETALRIEPEWCQVAAKIDLMIVIWRTVCGGSTVLLSVLNTCVTGWRVAGKVALLRHWMSRGQVSKQSFLSWRWIKLTASSWFDGGSFIKTHEGALSHLTLLAFCLENSSAMRQIKWTIIRERQCDKHGNKNDLKLWNEILIGSMFTCPIVNWQ